RHYAESFPLWVPACAGMLALLSACSSTPEVHSSPTPPPAEKVASAPASTSTAATTTPAAPTAAPIAEPAKRNSKKSKKELEEEAAAAVAAEAAAPVEPPLPPEAVQQFDRAVVLMSSGDTAQAEQSLKSLAATYPSYSGPLVNLGILHAKAGRYDE